MIGCFFIYCFIVYIENRTVITNLLFMKFKIIFALYSGFFSLSNSLFKRSVINIIQNKIADRGHHDNIDNLPTTEEQSLALPILEIVAVLEEESCEDYCIETKDDACGNSYVDEQTEDSDYYYYYY